MLNKIKIKIEKELKNFLKDINKQYGLSKISPFLCQSIEDFALRPGKRLRPVLFVAGYLAFAKKPALGLYRAAVAFEFLHDFMLIHDDIIDKSHKRRGKPTLHRLSQAYLRSFKQAKFSGEDMAMLIADIIYAMAMQAFLCVKEDAKRKEKALRSFVDAAIYTTAGEFIELLSGARNVDQISRKDIYRIYNLKTARYTFASPLSTGAILAGADKNEVNSLFSYGICLGLAFQIKDDILGMFGNEKRIGKSTISDLQEAKRTILLWYANHNSTKKQRIVIKKLLNKAKVSRRDLLIMRKIMQDCGALDYAQGQIRGFIKQAEGLIGSIHLESKYKKFLRDYPQKLLAVAY